MLDTSAWPNLGGLLFAAKRLVEGIWSGRHESVRTGSGLDFHDYRMYAPGDSPAEIDWKLFGRTDRHYVRRYRQQTDLNAYILVDVSSSMDFARIDSAGRSLRGSKVMTKLRYAQELAAAIAFLAIRQGDRAAMGLFAKKLFSHVPPGSTWAHLKRICATLEGVRSREAGGKSQETGDGKQGAGGPTTANNPDQTLAPPHSPAAPAAHTPAALASLPGDFRECLRQAHALRPRRGVLVLISDLIADPAEVLDGISRFRHDHFEVIVFHLLTRQELGLEGLDHARLQMVDSESRDRVRTDISLVQKRYRQLIDDHVQSLRRGCEARAADYQLLTLSDPPSTALRKYLSRRGTRA